MIPCSTCSRAKESWVSLPVVTYWKVDLSHTRIFSRVCNLGRTWEGDEERFWWLVCVIVPEMNLMNVLGCCHGSYSQFRTWGYGSFWALKAGGSSLTIRKKRKDEMKPFSREGMKRGHELPNLWYCMEEKSGVWKGRASNRSCNTCEIHQGHCSHGVLLSEP